MSVFTVLSRVDAYVVYVAEVEADSAEEAVDLAYDGGSTASWVKDHVIEFDARRLVALDDNGDEMEWTARGKG